MFRENVLFVLSAIIIAANGMDNNEASDATHKCCLCTLNTKICGITGVRRRGKTLRHASRKCENQCEALGFEPNGHGRETSACDGVPKCDETFTTQFDILGHVCADERLPCVNSFPNTDPLEGFTAERRENLIKTIRNGCILSHVRMLGIEDDGKLIPSEITTDNFKDSDDPESEAMVAQMSAENIFTSYRTVTSFLHDATSSLTMFCQYMMQENSADVINRVEIRAAIRENREDIPICVYGPRVGNGQIAAKYWEPGSYVGLFHNMCGMELTGVDKEAIRVSTELASRQMADDESSQMPGEEKV